MAPGDLRAWEPIREGIASKYRYIAYNQRYFKTEPWPDDGKNFSIPTLADDIATFITSFNAGPVHLVSWSFGGLVAMQAAVKNPSLVRSLILYEPSVISVLPAESAEGKAAGEDRSKMFAPVIAATKGGDAVQAANCYAKLCFNSDLAGSTASRRRCRQECSTTPGPCR
jgi:pimeloyl-ACP methyl ester carboxylesterase